MPWRRTCSNPISSAQRLVYPYQPSGSVAMVSSIGCGRWRPYTPMVLASTTRRPPHARAASNTWKLPPTFTAMPAAGSRSQPAVSMPARWTMGSCSPLRSTAPRTAAGSRMSPLV